MTCRKQDQFVISVRRFGQHIADKTLLFSATSIEKAGLWVNRKRTTTSLVSPCVEQAYAGSGWDTASHKQLHAAIL
jgi:hypothetical protein